MGTPQESAGRGSLGLNTNQPIVDQGTLAKTRHKSPTTLKRGSAPAPGANAHTGNGQTLASFDMQNAVIFVNRALLGNLKRSHASHRPIPDEQVITLAHEFTHVLQYKDIFTEISDRKKRADAIVEYHRKLINSMDESDYIKRVLAKELQAEKLAQRINIELLSHFSRSRGNRGFTAEQTRSLSKDKAKLWLKPNKADYSDRARKRYQRLKKNTTDPNPSSSTPRSGKASNAGDASADQQGTEKARFLPVAAIKSAFPVGKSPTLKKVVKLMISFNILIVVSKTQEDIK